MYSMVVIDENRTETDARTEQKNTIHGFKMTDENKYLKVSQR